MPVFRLTDAVGFPPPDLASPEGLLAVGGDLSEDRLIVAYASGIFPWYSEGEPLLWWSPDPRMVLYPESFHCSRRLARTIRSGVFQVTADTAFADVVDGCASARAEGTWITPAMRDAYTRLHEAGYAHAFECWRDGALAGGLYGVSLGGCFFGESMFTRETGASKVAMHALVTCCTAWGFRFVDCQVPNAHLRRLGAQAVPRSAFLQQLADALKQPTRRGDWTGDVAAALAAH
jgi:leucyl/phenylalanyl-tRNA--protein transferase